MKTEAATNHLVPRATEALKSLLGQVSAIKLKDMRYEDDGSGQTTSIVAHVDIYGHRHTLACEVKTASTSRQLQSALDDLRACTSRLGETATPMLIAPYLSPEARELCNRNRAGFLDLEGNARLVLGEVFIGMRSLPSHPKIH